MLDSATGGASVSLQGAYATTDGIPRVRPSVVVYFDILGFRSEIRAARTESESDGLLQRIATVIRDWYGENGVMRDQAAAEEKRERHWEVKAFTDNVILAKPIRYDPDGEAELGWTFSDVALLQMGFAEHGFFVRGGIAVGDVYVDDALVFGAGILDAYDAEQRAEGPRVILADSAVQQVERHLGYYASIERAPQNRNVLIDEDGQWFVNYLAAVWPDRTEEPFFNWLESHQSIVSTKLAAFASNPNVLSKYVWAARYHNYFCKHLPGGAPYQVSQAREPLRPTRLQDDAGVMKRYRQRHD